MIHTFFGGVFPAVQKNSTRRKPIAQLSRPPARVILPMTMSAGGCAAPLVQVGDRVTVGQPIAIDAAQRLPIHASVSGRVADIAPMPHPWGGAGEAIVLENDGLNTPWPGRPAPLDPETLTREQLLERVRTCGIVGMGGGAFPTWQKLEQAAGHIDTLIVNAAECEPYVTADHRLLLERSDQILRGTRVLARCLGAKHTAIVTEGDKLNAVEAVERRLRRKNSRVELYAIRTRYPLGAEKQIIQTVTGREIPTGKQPVDVKCLVLNVATVYAIQEALFKGLALTSRVITVTGGAVTRPRNLWVPIGTPLETLLEEAGGLKEPCARLLIGGPMMGFAPDELSAPAVKNVNALVALAAWEQQGSQAESVCIRCGKCVSSCPMHLAPTFIVQAMQAKDVRRLRHLHTEDCIACGCCSYICPARIPLVELVALAKEQVGKEAV